MGNGDWPGANHWCLYAAHAVATFSADAGNGIAAAAVARSNLDSVSLWLDAGRAIYYQKPGLDWGGVGFRRDRTRWPDRTGTSLAV